MIASSDLTALEQLVIVVKPMVDASIVFVEAVPAPSRTRVSRFSVRRDPPRTI